MQLESKDVKDGKHDGEIVWICDYRYNDYGDKPIRHVKPTRVIIRNKEETSKRILYSESFFSKLGKNDKPLAAVIAIVDNTGYRMLSGVSLSVFTTEAECNAHYVTQLETIRDGLHGWLNRVRTTVEAHLRDNAVETMKYKGIL